MSTSGNSTNFAITGTYLAGLTPATTFPIPDIVQMHDDQCDELFCDVMDPDCIVARALRAEKELAQMKNRVAGHKIITKRKYDEMCDRNIEMQHDNAQLKTDKAQLKLNRDTVQEDNVKLRAMKVHYLWMIGKMTGPRVSKCSVDNCPIDKLCNAEVEKQSIADGKTVVIDDTDTSDNVLILPGQAAFDADSSDDDIDADDSDADDSDYSQSSSVSDTPSIGI